MTTKEYKMNLSINSIKTNDWESKGIKLPSYDINEIASNTRTNPTWIHFGAGNIFRGFIGRVAQELINQNLMSTGIIAAETFDYEIIDRIYTPYDNLTLMADLNPTGLISYEVIGSIVDTLKVGKEYSEDFARLMVLSACPSLQLLSFTITEKGYATTNISGDLLPIVSEDIKNGPANPSHTMSIITSMLLTRFKSGAYPLAVVSMDNCSHNGDKIRNSVLYIANEWFQRGFVGQDFIEYISDESKISFPWSMIDKITPRPDSSIAKKIKDELGVEDMEPITTKRGTYIAPFVNAEIPQYLVIEDNFPNGRPSFEKAGIFMTDRDTVDKSERMKVTTCLNPLHTCLAVFGCLLDFTKISDEMKDSDLVTLITRMGYNEGLKVVTDPVILKPEAFIDEVIKERLPNPYIPDAPQRIATDTSLKMPIRFGETLKAYSNSDKLDVTSLTYIPLTIAGWLRYLLAVNDNGEALDLSSDPLMEELQSELSNVKYGDPNSVRGNIDALLKNKSIFAVDLIECGLKSKIEDMLSSMLEGPGAVRKTIKSYLS